MAGFQDRLFDRGLSQSNRIPSHPEDTGVLEDEPCAGNETAHYELFFVVRASAQVWNKLTFPPQNGRFWGPVPETGNFFRISTVVLCLLSRMFAF